MKAIGYPCARVLCVCGPGGEFVSKCECDYVYTENKYTQAIRVYPNTSDAFIACFLIFLFFPLAIYMFQTFHCLLLIFQNFRFFLEMIATCTTKQ